MRVLASDYDGTLRIEEKVTKADLEALARWREAGNLFVAVTGRSMESFTREIAENGFACDYIIANNGGVFYDGKMNRMQVNYMDFDRAMALIGYIRTLPCASYVINDGYYRHRIVVNEQEEDLKYGKMPQEKNEAELLASGKTRCPPRSSPISTRRFLTVSSLMRTVTVSISCLGGSPRRRDWRSCWRMPAYRCRMPSRSGIPIMTCP